MNCILLKVQPTDLAILRASIVLPTPGTSSIRAWPWHMRATTPSSTDSLLPTITFSTLSIILCATSLATSSSCCKAVSYVLSPLNRLSGRSQQIQKRFETPGKPHTGGDKSERTCPYYRGGYTSWDYTRTIASRVASDEKHVMTLVSPSDAKWGAGDANSGLRRSP